MGRYPNAGLVLNGRPTAIWNEYTLPEYGGGSSGGYPMWSYDAFGLGEFSSWVNPFNLNNGCATYPCDPPDLWAGNAQVFLNDNEQQPVMATIFDSWSNGNHYFINSNFYANGYLLK